MSKVYDLDLYRRTRKITSVSLLPASGSAAHYQMLEYHQLLTVCSTILETMRLRPLNISELHEALALFRTLQLKARTPEFKALMDYRVATIETLIALHNPKGPA
jgi:hypothetical protein